MSTSSILNLFSHSFSSLCPPYKCFTGYMCVRNRFKDFYDICIHILVILSPSFVFFINIELLSQTLSSLCPSYKTFIGYICVRNKSKDFYVSRMQVLVICDYSHLILSILNVLSDSFSFVCTSYSRFTCFMYVSNKLKQVWDSCIHILVIFWPLFVYFINFEPVTSCFQQFVSIL